MPVKGSRHIEFVKDSDSGLSHERVAPQASGEWVGLVTKTESRVLFFQGLSGTDRYCMQLLAVSKLTSRRGHA